MVINKSITSNEEAGMLSQSYCLPSTTSIKLAPYFRKMHSLNLSLKLYRITYTHHPTHAGPVHAYGVFNRKQSLRRKVLEIYRHDRKLVATMGDGRALPEAPVYTKTAAATHGTAVFVQDGRCARPPLPTLPGAIARQGLRRQPRGVGNTRLIRLPDGS